MARSPTTTERVLAYLKDAWSVSAPRYIAFKLGLSEGAVRKAANQLVEEGIVRKSQIWESAGWQYRRAGYITVYRIMPSKEGGE